MRSGRDWFIEEFWRIADDMRVDMRETMLSTYGNPDVVAAVNGFGAQDRPETWTYEVSFSRELVEEGERSWCSSVIVHELTHVSQHNEGRLRHVRAPFWRFWNRRAVTRFEGRTYLKPIRRTPDLKSLLSYYRQPWEREALLMQAETDVIPGSLDQRLPPDLIWVYERLKD